jgi:hypothetical protein
VSSSTKLLELANVQARDLGRCSTPRHGLNDLAAERHLPAALHWILSEQSSVRREQTAALVALLKLSSFA